MYVLDVQAKDEHYRDLQRMLDFGKHGRTSSIRELLSNAFAY